MVIFVISTNGYFHLKIQEPGGKLASSEINLSIRLHHERATSQPKQQRRAWGPPVSGVVSKHAHSWDKTTFNAIKYEIEINSSLHAFSFHSSLTSYVAKKGIFLRQSASTIGNKIILILFKMPLFVTRVTRKELRAECQRGTRALPAHTSRMTRTGSAGGPRGRASFRPPAWKCHNRPEIGPHRGGKLLRQNGSKACSKRKTRTSRHERGEGCQHNLTRKENSLG